MKDYKGLLEIAKSTARDALCCLHSISPDHSTFAFSADLPREIKASSDIELEKVILTRLVPTQLPILSEEIGFLHGSADESLRWIVDPLDGTVNFIRGIGSCAISIALWKADIPIFGVIAEYPSGSLYWGGRYYGSYRDDTPIKVSNVQNKSHAVLSTGYPARFNFDESLVLEHIKIVQNFNKVRMIGSASLSLIMVACGAADAYYESEIMLWDVAAGLAIVEGADGAIDFKSGRDKHSLIVFATNGQIKF